MPNGRFPSDKKPVSKDDMIKLVIATAKQAKAKMAIGGGIAVKAHGFRRETSDVDAFFHLKDKPKVLRAFRSLMGDDYVLECIHESMYIATPRDGEPEERIDLMFALGEPESDAIDKKEIKLIRNNLVPLFTTNWLVVVKFLAERDSLKDCLDIFELYRCGAYDIKDIVKIFVEQLFMPQEAVRFVNFMKQMDELAKSKRGIDITKLKK